MWLEWGKSSSKGGCLATAVFLHVLTCSQKYSNVAFDLQTEQYFSTSYIQVYKISSFFVRVPSIRQLTLTPHHTRKTTVQGSLSSCFNYELSCNEVLWQETFQAVSLPAFVLCYWWNAQGWLLLRALYQWRRASLDTCISFEICGVCFWCDLELFLTWS